VTRCCILCLFSLLGTQCIFNNIFLIYIDSVYHIRSDMASDPYGAVHVVWMQQEKDTHQWLYQYEQTDSRKDAYMVVFVYFFCF